MIGLTRSYTLTGGTLDGEAVPHDYTSGYFPGIYAWLEAYPLGLAGASGPLADLGLEGFLEWGSLKSDLKLLDAEGKHDVQGVETVQRMWGVGLVYRLAPYDMPDGPLDLRVFAGWMSATFALAQRTPLYESNGYAAVRFGADASLPVAQSDGWTYSVLFRAALLYTWADLNERETYATTSGLGWEAAGGVDVDMGSGFVLGMDYRLYAFPASFPAADDDTPALESDDLYHGFVILAGYRG